MNTDQQKPDLCLSEEEQKEYEEWEAEFRDTEALLRVLFQKAVDEYYDSRPLPDRQLDLSFMEEDAGEELHSAEEEQDAPRESHEENTGEKKKAIHRPFRRLRSLRGAAVLLIAFVLAGGIYYVMDSQLVYAARFHLEKVMYQISGKYYTSDEDLTSSSDIISIHIDSMEEIPQAVRFMPELYVPSYLPEGWELEKLVLSKDVKGYKMAKYTFVGKNFDVFSIDEELLLEDVNTNNYIDSNPIKLKNRDVSLLKDDFTGLSCVHYIEMDVSTTLSGQLSESEMLLVADSMEQRLK